MAILRAASALAGVEIVSSGPVTPGVEVPTDASAAKPEGQKTAKGKRVRTAPETPGAEAPPPPCTAAPATKEDMVSALKQVTAAVNLDRAHQIVATALGKEPGTVRVADVPEDKYATVVQLCAQALAEARAAGAAPR